MASPPFADVDALAAWVGQEINFGDARANAVLTAASVLVQTEVGADTAEAWSTVPAAVAQVVVQAAARVWFNPEGLVADSVDDYSRRWADGGESGVYLTRGERDILSAYRTSKPKGLWNLTTTRGDDYADQYHDVIGQPGEPMPFLPPGE